MKISVIVRTYNRPDLLKEALASVQLQSHTDWEVIIFDYYMKFIFDLILRLV